MADLTIPRPVIEVLVGSTNLAAKSLAFEVISDLEGSADTAILQIEDLFHEVAGKVKRGDPVVIRWGSDASNLFDVFQGVVRNVDAGRNPMTIRCIDYSTILALHRISMTYQDETAEGIIQALLADTGLGVEAKSSGVNFERLPLFNVTLREAIDTVSSRVRKETEQLWYDSIRDGVFRWGPPDYDQEPVHEFHTGIDVIRFDPAQKNLSTLTSLIVPARTGETVLVDGKKYFVRHAIYRWQDGGRTTLGLEACP